MKKYWLVVIFALIFMNSYGIMVGSSACHHNIIVFVDPYNNMYTSMLLNRGDKITITWESTAAIGVAIMNGANYALCENGYSHSYLDQSETYSTDGVFVYNVIQSDIYYGVILSSGSYSASIMAHVEFATSWTSYLWLLLIPFALCIIGIVKKSRANPNLNTNAHDSV